MGQNPMANLRQRFTRASSGATHNGREILWFRKFRRPWLEVTVPKFLRDARFGLKEFFAAVLDMRSLPRRKASVSNTPF
jgi:hypothetical protein